MVQVVARSVSRPWLFSVRETARECIKKTYDHWSKKIRPMVVIFCCKMFCTLFSVCFQSTHISNLFWKTLLSASQLESNSWYPAGFQSFPPALGFICCNRSSTDPSASKSPIWTLYPSLRPKSLTVWLRAERWIGLPSRVRNRSRLGWVTWRR